jgi:antitoxin ParD1/3/4
MTKRAPLNVSLTPQLVAFVAAQFGSGRYGSASEVVRTSLRLLEEQERRTTALPALMGESAPVVPDAR